jgi:glutathionyl-hydroquinone reductase
MTNPTPFKSFFALLVLLAAVSFFSDRRSQTKMGSITDWVKPGDKSGEFKRQQSQFRDWIKDEPDAKFAPEKDRYHLYVSYACPWGRQ